MSDFRASSRSQPPETHADLFLLTSQSSSATEQGGLDPRTHLLQEQLWTDPNTNLSSLFTSPGFLFSEITAEDPCPYELDPGAPAYGGPNLRLFNTMKFSSPYTQTIADYASRSGQRALSNVDTGTFLVAQEASSPLDPVPNSDDEY